MVSSNGCSLRPSMHAKDKMIETGINKTEILESILKGVKKALHNKVASTFKGFEVVYRPLPCNYFIITVYWKNR